MASESAEVSERPSGVARTLVIGAAVLAVLLLGAAVGLLVKLPGSTTSAVPASGSVDVGFCQDMAQHHLQGIQMANIARDRSTDPEVRQEAYQDVVRGLNEEVAYIWLYHNVWGLAAKDTVGGLPVPQRLGFARQDAKPWWPQIWLDQS